MSESPALLQLRRSPYIQRPIDNTALAAYVQCPTKYFYGMVQHRRREGPPSAAIAAGSAMHKMLEVHYKTGGDAEMVRLALLASWEPHDRPDDHRTPERLWTVYNDFLRYYGPHDQEVRNNGSTVGYPGENALVEMPVEIGWEGALHPYTGKIDRVIEWQGLYYVEDHKTTSALGSRYFAQFDPSNQMMGYAWLAQKMTGLPIAGVRINAIGILKTQTKFSRQIVSYAPQRLHDWAENYNRLVIRLETAHAELARGASADDAFPRTWQCAERFGMCSYCAVCSTIPGRRQQVLESEFVEKAWDPMAAPDDATVEAE